MLSGAQPVSWVPEVWRVVAVEQENQDTVTLEVEPADKIPKSICQPGQFHMLYGFGIGEIPVSISSIGSHTLKYTIRQVGAVSRALSRLSPGAALGVRGPFGSAWPQPQEKDQTLLIMAGGVGLAPLKPVIEAAIQNRTQLRLLYGSRDPEHILFKREARQWRKAGVEVLVTVDSAQESWNGAVGVVTQLLDLIRWDPQKTLALLCGPEIMMRFSVDKLLQSGLDAQKIFLSMERNMKCAMGWCGHCQYGNEFVCKDGPVFRYDRIAGNLRVKEL